MAKRKGEAQWVESRKRWQVKVQNEGIRRTFIDHTPGKTGKISAEQQADRWLEDPLVDENARVGDLLDEYFENLKLTTSKSHYRPYDGYIRNWIKPVIGMRKVVKLTQSDLQLVIDKAYASKKLSEKTLEKMRACLMNFIKYCRSKNLTTFRPDTLKIPASAKASEKTIASADEIKILFSVTTTLDHNKKVEDRYIHAYRFAVLTGIRPGELIGLIHDDIIGSRIKISRSINAYNEVTSGKNRNARRTYALDEHALKVLSDQKQMLISLGEISPYVFPDKNRDFIKQQTLRKSWKRYCDANGIKAAKTPYELRHTFVSVNDEMPSALKKMVVGHSKNMDTEGIYGHEKADDMDRAAQYINAAFKEILGW